MVRLRTIKTISCCLVLGLAVVGCGSSGSTGAAGDATTASVPTTEATTASTQPTTTTMPTPQPVHGLVFCTSRDVRQDVATITVLNPTTGATVFNRTVAEPVDPDVYPADYCGDGPSDTGLSPGDAGVVWQHTFSASFDSTFSYVAATDEINNGEVHAGVMSLATGVFTDLSGAAPAGASGFVQNATDDSNPVIDAAGDEEYWTTSTGTQESGEVTVWSAPLPSPSGGGAVSPPEQVAQITGAFGGLYVAGSTVADHAVADEPFTISPDGKEMLIGVANADGSLGGYAECTPPSATFVESCPDAPTISIADGDTNILLDGNKLVTLDGHAFGIADASDDSPPSLVPSTGLSYSVIAASPLGSKLVLQVQNTSAQDVAYTMDSGGGVPEIVPASTGIGIGAVVDWV